MTSSSRRDALAATMVFCLMVGGGLLFYWVMEGDLPVLIMVLALAAGTVWSALRLSRHSRAK